MVVIGYYCENYGILKNPCTELAKIKIANLDYEIGINYYAGNATAAYGIAIEKNGRGRNITLEWYEYYSKLDAFTLVGDSLLQIELSGESYMTTRHDTYNINLYDFK